MTVWSGTYATIAHDIDIVDRAEFLHYPNTKLPENYMGIFGYVDKFSCAYKSDGGKAIAAYWRSKTLDPSQEAQLPELDGWWFQVDKVRLIYEDIDADTPVTMYMSNDGGVTWIHKTRDLGTGDLATKTADFEFLNEDLTGQFFDVKVESCDDDTTFAWLGIEIDLIPRSEHFEI